MEDYIVRATAANSSIRAFAMTSKGIVEEARQRHNTSPVVTAALGRLRRRHDGGDDEGRQRSADGTDPVRRTDERNDSDRGFPGTCERISGGCRCYAATKQTAQAGCGRSCRCRYDACHQRYGIERAVCGNHCAADQ